MDGYRLLAARIVATAAEDYKNAVQRLNQNPWDDAARSEFITLRNFFHSEWFHDLADVDGDKLMDRIEEVYA